MLEGVLFHLRKEMKTILMPGLQNTRSLPRDQLQQPWVINQLNVIQPITWLLCFCYDILQTILPLSHTIQFWMPRPSSALGIVCVKLYFQSFMSNLNSRQLHSDLDRILNLAWTLNPFCKTQHMPLPAPTHTHTCEHTHIWTWFALTLVKLEFSGKYPLKTRALHNWVFTP